MTLPSSHSARSIDIYHHKHIPEKPTPPHVLTTPTNVSYSQQTMSSSSPAVDDKPASTKKPGPKSKTGSKPAPVDHKFEIGDIVLARLRGYPPWRQSFSFLNPPSLHADGKNA